jgi:hypothetical protein
VRSRTLIVLLHGNPYFENLLGADERVRLDTVIEVAESEIRQQGYRCIQVGQGFSADDYVDVGHFMASGGRKIARLIADDLKRDPP